MAETTKTYDRLPEFIKKSIDKEIAEATKEEIDKAIERLKERKAQIISGVLLHVQKQVNFNTFGETLQITVKIQ